MVGTQKNLAIHTAKNTVISPDRANRPKLCGNCAFPQNFYTSKSGEVTVFFAVSVKDCYFSRFHMPTETCS